MLVSERFSMQAYLARIGLATRPPATLEGLTQLMRAQLCHVPFENLDVQAGRRVSLQPDDIVEKIIAQGRGGYCYEVNGVFSLALQAMGLPYQWVAARPMFYPARRPRTHMAVLVHIGQQAFLCDLGFGSWGPTLPLPLDHTGQEVRHGSDVFKISASPSDGHVLSAWVHGAWVTQYGFDLWPQEWVDFEPANHLNSTHPEAIFVKQLLVIQHTPSGRKMLSGSRFKVFEGGTVTERLLSDAEVDACLQQEFHLPALKDLRQNSPARATP